MPPTSAAEATAAKSSPGITAAKLNMSVVSSCCCNKIRVFSSPGSEQMRVRQGAPQRATGMYTSVHEDRERGATMHGAYMRRLYGLENSGGAHSRAHAHCDHAIFLLAPSQAVHDRGGSHGTRGAERMAERDGATQRVDCGGIEAELLDDGEALR